MPLTTWMTRQKYGALLSTKMPNTTAEPDVTHSTKCRESFSSSGRCQRRLRSGLQDQMSNMERKTGLPQWRYTSVNARILRDAA